jgi:ubiquinone/menaquinone biosynthesis C-methylase UbiE
LRPESSGPESRDHKGIGNMHQHRQASADPVALYERMGERTTQPYALQLLDKFATVDGLSLLDVAAGTGGMAVAAAERGARAVAIDLNPAMISRTRERLAPFKQCRADVMDFRKLAFAPASFDITLSIFGVLAFPIWQQGLSEMMRVTRSNGRVALVMWTHRRDCSPAHLLKRVFDTLFPDRKLWQDGLFPQFSERELATTLQNAGCIDVQVDVSTLNWSPYSSVDVVRECDPMFRGFPGYSALDAEEMAALQVALDLAFKTYAGSDGIIRLPTEAFVVTARKA